MNHNALHCKQITKIADGYVPSEKEEYMCDAHREYFRQKLLKWREELLEKESTDPFERLREENLNEPDFSDRATAETEVELELHTKDRVRKLIEKIDLALDRIVDGSYGYCEETGSFIKLERLEARPIATLCVEAQERHERFERNHNDDVEYS